VAKMDDQEYFQLLSYLKGKSGESKDYQEWAAQFKEKNNHIYFGGKRVIPRYEMTWVISMFHDDPTMAHQSAGTVYNHMDQRYTWQNMRRDIVEYCKTCYKCQQRGSTKQNNPKKAIPPGDIFERWGIDIVGPLPITERGNRYIVVAMDYFSRWPEARPLKAANSETVATFIYEEIICRFGPPKVIQSDQGTHFVNEMIKDLTKRFQVKHSLSSPYHPQSNGLVERFNKTLCEGLAKVADVISDWDKYIQPVLFAYRTKQLRISNKSPYVLAYGKEPTMVMDESRGTNTMVERLMEITDKVPQLRESARRAIQRSQEQLNEKLQGKSLVFSKGELVWYFDKAKSLRHDTKLEPKWKGPFQIQEVLPRGAYKLAMDGKTLRTTINGNLLKPYYGRKGWILTIPMVSPQNL
jgi:transposase InsO family protein